MQELNPGKTWQQGHSRQEKGIVHQVGRHEIPKLELEGWDCEVDPVCVNIIICNCSIRKSLWQKNAIYVFCTQKETACICKQAELLLQWNSLYKKNHREGWWQRSRSLQVGCSQTAPCWTTLGQRQPHQQLSLSWGRGKFRWGRLGKLKDLQSGPGCRENVDD